MKSCHFLFLIGLTFNPVIPAGGSSNSAARNFHLPPSKLPHIPYHLEQSSSFRELLSWFDPEVIGWMTRRNTLRESIISNALSDESDLRATFTDTNNSAEIKSHLAPPPNIAGKFKKRRRRQTSSQRGSKRATPQCTALSPTKREFQIFPPSMYSFCHFVNDDLLYPKYLVCNSENMTKIPDFPDVPLQLDRFELNSTKVVNVPEMTFANLEVTSVRLIQNAIESFHPEAFLGIQSTKLVEISHNENLTWIWFDNCFVGLNDVKSLMLEFNQISYEGFNDLYDEDAVGTTTGAFPNLTALSLRGNPLKYLPKTIFAPLQYGRLRMLILHDCQLQLIHPDALAYLPHLLQLDLNDNPGLKNNLIPPLRNLYLSGANLSQLDLARIGLRREAMLEILQLFAHSLTTLDLRGNNFVTLGRQSFPESMPKLRSMNLADCGLSYLEDGIFDGLPKLETLMLNSNRFKAVPPPIGTLRNLLTFDFSDNDADSEDGRPVPTTIKPFIFQHLEHLKYLIFTNTYLKELRVDHLSGLDRLQVLFLNRCGLVRIADFTFTSVPSLLNLNLSENEDLETPNANTFYGLTALQTLDLNSTQFHIRTFNRPLLPHLANDHPQVNDLDFVTVGSILKAALNPNYDEELEDVVENKLRPFRHLTHLDSLYLFDNDIDSLHPTLFSDLPNLKVLDLGENKIKIWSERIFASNRILSKLYLGENLFHSLTESMLADFSQIPALPEMRSKVIDLRRNGALVCDLGSCRLKAGMESGSFDLTDWKENPDFYKCRISETKHVNIRDLSDSFCASFEEPDDPGNSTTIRTPPTTEPTTETETSTEETRDQSEAFGGPKKTIVILIGLGTVVVALVICVYLKRAQFRLYWFGLKLNAMRELSRKKNVEVEESTYDYDVFISYSQHDSEFIQELVPELEGNGKFLPLGQKSGDLTFDINFDSGSTCSSTVNMVRDDEIFRVCLHLRDFQVGAPITENIIECVDKSRKVLIVISKKYLESQWCLFEMNLAYHRLVEGRRSSIVLVLLENIPVKDRSKVLSHLMKSRTYLEWPRAQGHIHKELFWRRLKAALSFDESNC